MPPKRKLLHFHKRSRPSPLHSSHKPRLCHGNPQVVIAPFMRDVSSQRKYRYTSLPCTADLFNKEDFSDVRILIGEDTYFAHRCILSTASDVFARMLSSEWLEGSSQVAELRLLEDLECVRVFDRFLYFIYSGTVVMDESYVVPLYVLADKYNIKSLCDECIKVIVNGLKVFKVIQNGNGSMGNQVEGNGSLGNQVEVEPFPPRSIAIAGTMETSESSDYSEEGSEDEEEGERSTMQASPLVNVSTNFEGRARSSNLLNVSNIVPDTSSTPGTSALRVTKLIPSETFSDAMVLRLLNYEALHQPALRNLEARVGNQIALGNYTSLWNELPHDVIIEILSDSQFCHPEFNLFLASLKYLEAKPCRTDNETGIVQKVLECIRFPQMSIRELYQAERCALVMNHVKDSMVSAMRYKLFKDCLHPVDMDRERWVGAQYEQRHF